MSIKLSRVDQGVFSILALATAFFWVAQDSFDSTTLILFMLIGLIIAIFASEKAVHGMDILGEKLGLSPYVAGVLSSLASNFPELVIGGFAVLAGQAEFAIAFIVIATGFNILMLGILIVIGNYVRKGPIHVPQEVIDVEVPIIRVAIVMTGSIFVLGIVLFALAALEKAENTGAEVVPYLPYEAAIITVLVYVLYLYFIIKHNLKEQKAKMETQTNELELGHKVKKREVKKGNLIFVLFLAFTFIFFAGEMISKSVELFLDKPGGIEINEFQLAFLIGAAASIPEHAIALIAVRKEGGIELGLGNLIAGSMQNLLLMVGLVAIFSFIAAWLNIEGNTMEGIPLVHFVKGEHPVPFLLVQFGFAWLMLFLIKSSMTDNNELDIYEGITITIAQVFVFVIFLRGILII
ncbi:MAG: hypothetical protein ACXAC7_17265 [Candidatus Hodarchaeales archaeon]